MDVVSFSNYNYNGIGKLKERLITKMLILKHEKYS